jgi:iron complex outermembrane receptor protein
MLKNKDPMRKHRLSLLAVILAGTVAPIAQDQATSPDAAGENASVLAEVTVTAQKRSQNLQDVPVAVSAVDGATLANANVTSAAELGKIVPSLRFACLTAASSS